jgi:predicted enzyme related to lactoylglutathione lyase
MTGRVVHFELPYEDQERATAFYAGAFGWQAQSLPELSYVLVTTGPTASQGGGPQEAGFVNGGMLPRGELVSGPVVTVEVDDIDAALADVERLGGTTVEPRAPVGDMGFAAYFRDPEGNLMGLWQNASPPR